MSTGDGWTPPATLADCLCQHGLEGFEPVDSLLIDLAASDRAGHNLIGKRIHAAAWHGQVLPRKEWPHPLSRFPRKKLAHALGLNLGNLKALSQTIRTNENHLPDAELATAADRLGVPLQWLMTGVGADPQWMWDYRHLVDAISQFQFYSKRDGLREAAHTPKIERVIKRMAHYAVSDPGGRKVAVSLSREDWRLLRHVIDGEMLRSRPADAPPTAPRRDYMQRFMDATEPEKLRAPKVTKGRARRRPGG